MGRPPIERRVGFVCVMGERIKKGRRKRGAVRFRIESSDGRDEIVELRPGDSISSYLKSTWKDGVHEGEDVMRFEATLLPPS